MVKLKADFVFDWVSQLRSHMIQVQGWDAAEIARLDDRDIRIYFFESLRRKLASRVRAIKIADDFRCPQTVEAGWKALQDKVRKGEDLNPHLSTRHASLFNNDGLFAEWEVHHFHLGIGPDPKHPSYVARTELLVFALVDDNTFCAINVCPHRTSWEDTGILESIHRNWPDIINKYRRNAVTAETLDKAQRKTIRRKNVNVLTSAADGTVYIPIGGGVTCSGAKFASIQRADYWHAEIHSLQARFESQLGELMPTFEQRGYAGEDEIEAQLKITETGCQAFFPKYGVLADLRLDGAEPCT
jgi:hypothetical protein